MRHSRALFAAALALTAAACGQGIPTEPSASAAPAGPAYEIQAGGGTDSATGTSANTTPADSTAVTGPGSGDGRGVFWGGGG